MQNLYSTKLLGNGVGKKGYASVVIYMYSQSHYNGDAERMAAAAKTKTRPPV